MSLEKILNEQIERAIAEGKFDNLKGAGKPLDLDDYFAMPEETRVGTKLLKDKDFLPPEVELLKEIAALKEKLKTVAASEKPQLAKRLSERQLELAMMLERRKKR